MIASKLKLIGCILTMLCCINSLPAQTRVIFDTDFGGDADDLGALAMLHHFQDEKSCQVLGIMLWINEQYAVSAVDAVNRYYRHPDIPIGVRLRETYYGEETYNKVLADHFPHTLQYADAYDAVTLYRRILAAEADRSVTIVVVGPVGNIKNLLRSSPDRYSPLGGKELIRRKVKEFVVMGGQFPSGEWEWNFFGGIEGDTRSVLEELPEVPVTFSGYELGQQVLTGKRFNSLPKDTPLYQGFLYYSAHAPWMKESYRPGIISDNASFDQTAVLYAVKGGVGTYWDKVTNGICVADDKGGNVWKPQNHPTNHAYLVLKAQPEAVAEVIYRYMLGE